MDGILSSINYFVSVLQSTLYTQNIVEQMFEKPFSQRLLIIRNLYLLN